MAILNAPLRLSRVLYPTGSRLFASHPGGIESAWLRGEKPAIAIATTAHWKYFIERIRSPQRCGSASTPGGGFARRVGVTLSDAASPHTGRTLVSDIGPPGSSRAICGHQPLHQTKTKLLPSRSITASARASRLQWFRLRATCAQTNSRAPSIVLNQFDDLWSPSAYRRARDRRSSWRTLACHLVVHAKLHLSCGAHPR